MDIQGYIESGILHDYCVGNLSPAGRLEVEQTCAQYPEVRAELQQLQNLLEKYAEGGASAPAPQLKQNIWNTLENINKERVGDLNDMPLINKYSDYQNWKRIVAPLMPQQIPTGTVAMPLRDAAGIQQTLVIAFDNVAEESHEHEKESFLILEGECECYVGDNLYRLGPGGFLEIPLYTSHNVRLLSPYVVAVVQTIAL